MDKKTQAKNIFKKFQMLEKAIDTVKINDEDYNKIISFTNDSNNNNQKLIKYLKGERHFFLNQMVIDCFFKIFCTFENGLIRITIKSQDIENNDWLGMVKIDLDGAYVDSFVLKDFGILSKDEMGNALENYEKAVKIGVDFALSIWIFFSEYKSTEIIKVSEEKRSNSKNANKKYKKKTSVVRITKKVYQIDQEKMPKETHHNANYTRYIESWTVRGHWRTTKTGKEVWVKPHKKGNGEINQKIYKI